MTLTAKKILFGAMASLLLYSFAGFYNAESGQRAERDSTGNRFVVKMLTFSQERKERLAMPGKGRTKKKISSGFQESLVLGMGAMLWESYGMGKIARVKDFKRCCHGFGVSSHIVFCER